MDTAPTLREQYPIMQTIYGNCIMIISCIAPENDSFFGGTNRFHLDQVCLSDDSDHSMSLGHSACCTAFDHIARFCIRTVQGDSCKQSNRQLLFRDG